MQNKHYNLSPNRFLQIVYINAGEQEELKNSLTGLPNIAQELKNYIKFINLIVHFIPAIIIARQLIYYYLYQ